MSLFAFKVLYFMANKEFQTNKQTKLRVIMRHLIHIKLLHTMHYTIRFFSSNRGEMWLANIFATRWR